MSIRRQGKKEWTKERKEWKKTKHCLPPSNSHRCPAVLHRIAIAVCRRDVWIRILLLRVLRRFCRSFDNALPKSAWSYSVRSLIQFYVLLRRMTFVFGRPNAHDRVLRGVAGSTRIRFLLLPLAILRQANSVDFCRCKRSWNVAIEGVVV